MTPHNDENLTPRDQQRLSEEHIQAIEGLAEVLYPIYRRLKNEGIITLKDGVIVKTSDDENNTYDN